jgi:hypothetical protein
LGKLRVIQLIRDVVVELQVIFTINNLLGVPCGVVVLAAEIIMLTPVVKMAEIWLAEFLFMAVAEAALAVDFLRIFAVASLLIILEMAKLVERLIA